MAVLVQFQTYVSFYADGPKNTVNNSTLSSSNIFQLYCATAAMF